MKKKIDIEKLLQWAFNDELCKGLAVNADPWSAIENYGMLGTRVDIGHKGSQGLGFVDGEPHPDAKAVARVIAEFPKMTRLRPSFDALSLFDRYLPCVDLSSRQLLKRAEFNVATLVISCATFRKRPEWNLGEPTLQPMIRSEKGHPVVYGVRSFEVGYDPEAAGFADLVAMKADAKRGGYNLKMVPRVPLTWENPAPFQFAEARAEYIVWACALCDIAEHLAADDALIDHELTGDFPSLAPWHEVPAAKGATLRSDISPDVRVPLPLKPKRRAPLPQAEWSPPASVEESERRKLRVEDLL